MLPRKYILRTGVKHPAWGKEEHLDSIESHSAIAGDLSPRLKVGSPWGAYPRRG
jgi:hypothetical protein